MSGRTVLLVSANSEMFPMPVYPVALARLAGAVKRAGHQARQYDVLLHGLPALGRTISESHPDLVGVSLRNIDNTDSANDYSYVAEYIGLVREIRKRTPAPIVVGGSGFSLFPREIMRLLGADYGVVGPGEEALPSLLDALDNGADVSDIPHLLTADSQSPPSALDAPFSGGSEHDPDIVRYYWRAGGMIGLQTKRGCPRRCSYCTYPLIEGHRVRWADPVGLVDEMERLEADCGVRYFFIADSVFNLDPARETAFAEEICRRSLSISWGAFFAPDHMDADYLAVLKRSGLIHVEFGTDSLSEKVLVAFRKDFGVAEALEASSLCTDMGLFCAHYLIFGGPGETPQSIRETISNTRRLKKCVFFPFAGVRIYPGTGLHATALEERAISPDDDCLAPVFYFAKGLDGPAIWKIVEEEMASSLQWVAPTRYAALVPAMRRLRKMGAEGPLWEYLLP